MIYTYLYILYHIHYLSVLVDNYGLQTNVITGGHQFFYPQGPQVPAPSSSKAAMSCTFKTASSVALGDIDAMGGTENHRKTMGKPMGKPQNGGGFTDGKSGNPIENMVDDLGNRTMYWEILLHMIWDILWWGNFAIKCIVV